MELIMEHHKPLIFLIENHDPKFLEHRSSLPKYQVDQDIHQKHQGIHYRIHRIHQIQHRNQGNHQKHQGIHQDQDDQGNHLWNLHRSIRHKHRFRHMDIQRNLNPLDGWNYVVMLKLRVKIFSC